MNVAARQNLTARLMLILLERLTLDLSGSREFVFPEVKGQSAARIFIGPFAASVKGQIT